MGTWVDEPAGGRGGGNCPPIGTGKACGEDSNYGIVSVHGDPYTELQETMAKILVHAADLHRRGADSIRCPHDTTAFASKQGQLQLLNGNSEHLCLTAGPAGNVTVQACSASPAQSWEMLYIGGAVGHRLRNVGSLGCLSHLLGDTQSHQLRADNNCATPDDWLWAPSWQHDDDCSLMQYCGYPTKSTGPGGWAHNVCTYDQQCVVVEGQAARVGDCDGSAAQKFAFVTPSSTSFEFV